MADINSESSQLTEAVRQAFIALRTLVNGNQVSLSALATASKGSLVESINEVVTALEGKADVGAFSGSNTGDETAGTIKTKLGISVLSGSNTGDQDLSPYATAAALTAGLGGKQSTISFGAGVFAALGANVGSLGAPVIFNGAGGSPSSINLTNATNVPAAQLSGLVPLANGGRIQTRAFKGADKTMTTNTTLANDSSSSGSSLTGFPIVAGKQYMVCWKLVVASAGGGGSFRSHFMLSSGTLTGLGTCGMTTVLSNSNLAQISCSSTIFGAISASSSSQSATTGWALIECATSGSFDLQWAQNAATGDTILKAGSYVSVEQLN